MKSLARANIEHNWKSSSAIMFLLLMIGLVFYLALGYGQNMIQSLNAHTKQLNADILISLKRGPLADIKNIERESRRGAITMAGIDYKAVINAWSSDNIDEIVPYSRLSIIPKTWGFKGEKSFISTHIVDIGPDSMSFPKHIPVSIKGILATGEFVAISKPLSKKYNLQLNDTIDLYNRFSSEHKTPMKVGAILDGPQITTSFIMATFSQTKKAFRGNILSTVSMYMVRVKDKTKIASTVTELSQLLGDKTHVSTPTDKVSVADLNTLLGQQKDLIVIAALVLLTLCIVAGFIMRSSILAYRFEFGTLLALGISKLQIAKIALQQSLWLGVFSAALTYCCALVIKFYLETIDIYLVYPTWLLLGVPTGIIVISILSGLLSISAIVKIKPIELMR